MEIFTQPWLQRLTREKLARKVMIVWLKVQLNLRELYKDVMFVWYNLADLQSWKCEKMII